MNKGSVRIRIKVLNQILQQQIKLQKDIKPYITQCTKTKAVQEFLCPNCKIFKLHCVECFDNNNQQGCMKHERINVKKFLQIQIRQYKKIINNLQNIEKQIQGQSKQRFKQARIQEVSKFQNQIKMMYNSFLQLCQTSQNNYAIKLKSVKVEEMNLKPIMNNKQKIQFYLNQKNQTQIQNNLSAVIQKFFSQINELKKNKSDQLKTYRENYYQSVLDKINQYAHIDYYIEFENLKQLLQTHKNQFAKILQQKSSRIKQLENLLLQKTQDHSECLIKKSKTNDFINNCELECCIQLNKSNSNWKHSQNQIIPIKQDQKSKLLDQVDKGDIKVLKNIIAQQKSKINQLEQKYYKEKNLNQQYEQKIKKIHEINQQREKQLIDFRKQYDQIKIKYQYAQKQFEKVTIQRKKIQQSQYMKEQYLRNLENSIKQIQSNYQNERNLHIERQIQLNKSISSKQSQIIQQQRIIKEQRGKIDLKDNQIQQLKNSCRKLIQKQQYNKLQKKIELMRLEIIKLNQEKQKIIRSNTQYDLINSQLQLTKKYLQCSNFWTELITTQQKIWLIKNIKSKFTYNKTKLLYIASHNNFKSDNFHRLCDDKQNILVLVKCMGVNNKDGHILGGFTSNKIGSVNDKNTAFIFSITHLQIMNLIGKKATIYDKEYGPIFGDDFKIKSQKIYSNYHIVKSSYEKKGDVNKDYLCGGLEVMIEDYEVHQLI